MTASIHPSAIVDSSARLGDDVVIGPNAVVEADTVIGDGCRLDIGAVVRRYTSLGKANVVGPYTVLGGDPQDFGFNPSDRSTLRIGDRNQFREGCTLSRGTGADSETVVGDDNLFMTASHVGHNGVVGSNCVLANGCAVGGYAELGDRVFLSAHVVVHQFCWIGEMVMTRGNSGTSQHVPPYCMVRSINTLSGLNKVGLRRAEHVSAADVRQIDEAYRLLYRSGLGVEKALAEMDARTDWGEPADVFRRFVRRVVEAEGRFKRGLAAGAGRRGR